MRVEIDLRTVSDEKQEGSIPVFHQLCILAFLTDGNPRLKLELLATRSDNSLVALRYFGNSVEITHLGSYHPMVLTVDQQASLSKYLKDFTALARADAAVNDFMRAKQEAGVTDGTGALLIYVVHRARRDIPSHQIILSGRSYQCPPAHFLGNSTSG